MKSAALLLRLSRALALSLVAAGMILSVSSTTAAKEKASEATRPIAGREEHNTAAAMRRLDPLIEQMMNDHGAPGVAVAVLRGGKLIYDRGFGWADVEAQVPVTHRSRFRIASVSKPITATAVLQLVEQRKVQLNDHVFEVLDLQRHVPEGHKLDPRWREVTIAQLLAHTGGWDRDETYDPMFIPERIHSELGVGYPIGPWEIIRYMVRQPLNFAPGKRYAYSNFGYCMLGRVVERASGQSYENYVRQEIFKRLDITGGVIGRSRIEDRHADEVRYYPARPSQQIAVVGSGAGEIKTPQQYGGWYHEALDSVGGWCLTAEEMARFGAAIGRRSDSPLLRAESISQMLSPAVPMLRQKKQSSPSRHYCFGWAFTDGGPQQRWHDHSGGLPGTSSALLFLDDGTTLAYVANGGSVDIPKLQAGLQKLVDELNGDDDHD